MTAHATPRTTELAIPIPMEGTRHHVNTAAAPDEAYPNMALLCRTLAGQVETLDVMFRHTSGLARLEEGPTEAYERLSRLAMRAQAQSVRTVALLRHLVPPPVEPEPVDEEEAADPDTGASVTPSDSPFEEMLRLAGASLANVEQFTRLADEMRAEEGRSPLATT